EPAARVDAPHLVAVREAQREEGAALLAEEHAPVRDGRHHVHVALALEAPGLAAVRDAQGEHGGSACDQEELARQAAREVAAARARWRPAPQLARERAIEGRDAAVLE